MCFHIPRVSEKSRQLVEAIRRKHRFADSSYKNTVSFSSARKTEHFASLAVSVSNPKRSPLRISYNRRRASRCQKGNGSARSIRQVENTQRILTVMTRSET